MNMAAFSGHSRHGLVSSSKRCGSELIERIIMAAGADCLLIDGSVITRSQKMAWDIINCCF